MNEKTRLLPFLHLPRFTYHALVARFVLATRLFFSGQTSSRLPASQPGKFFLFNCDHNPFIMRQSRATLLQWQLQKRAGFFAFGIRRRPPVVLFFRIVFRPFAQEGAVVYEDAPGS
ncbi:MAG: hypothetical protein WCB27_11920 [Thermoguttaceae bacterium]